MTADAGVTADAGGPDTVGPEGPYPATDGSVKPTDDGGTSAVFSDCLGNHVSELASGRSSHGGGCCFTRHVSKLRRGMFFVRRVDPYDGPVQDS